jgi:hypothetical protein
VSGRFAAIAAATPASRDRFADFLRDRRAQFVYVAVFLEGFLLWGGVTYLGSVGTARYGFDQFSVGLLIALFGVGTMVGGSLMAQIRRRASENTLAAVGGTLMGTAFLSLVPRCRAPRRAAPRPGFVGLRDAPASGHGDRRGGPREGVLALRLNLFAGMSTGTAVLGRLVDAGHYETLFAIVGVGLIGVGLGTSLAPPRPMH